MISRMGKFGGISGERDGEDVSMKKSEEEEEESFPGRIRRAVRPTMEYTNGEDSYFPFLLHE